MAHRTKDCWTERLWNLAHADPKCERTREGGILVQGPYGAAARHFSEYEKVVGIGFRNEGDAIVLIGDTNGHLGQSLYLRELQGREDGPPPPVETQERPEDKGK